MSFRTAVVCPIIDVISDETFEYMAGSDMTYGGFNWKLNFRWYPVPQREMDRRKGDRTLPVRYKEDAVCLILCLFIVYLEMKGLKLHAKVVKGIFVQNLLLFDNRRQKKTEMIRRLKKNFSCEKCHFYLQLEIDDYLLCESCCLNGIMMFLF